GDVRREERGHLLRTALAPGTLDSVEHALDGNLGVRWSGHESLPNEGRAPYQRRRGTFQRARAARTSGRLWISPVSEMRMGEATLHGGEPGHGLGIQRVHLGVELRHLEAGLDVGRVLHVAPDPVTRRLAVLRDEHEAGEEDALQRGRHGEKPEGE